MNDLRTVLRAVLGSLLLTVTLACLPTATSPATRPPASPTPITAGRQSGAPTAPPATESPAASTEPAPTLPQATVSSAQTAAADWQVTGDVTGTLLGFAVATAGDVDGDGYADVVVGAPRYSNGETEEGAVFLYRGGPTGLEATPASVLEGGQAYAWFGQALAPAGDVDGDGYADIIVGVPRFDVSGTGPLTDTGQAHLYRGGPSGLVTTPAWSVNPTNQAHARFGVAVGTAGDVNGDGYSDVVVTANGYDAQQPNEGAAFVYLGGRAGLATTPAWTAHPTDQAYANFGRAAGTAGDVNRDGYSDLVVGAPWYDTGDRDEDRDKGAAYLYLGNSGGLEATPAWIFICERRESELGIAVGTAGDVNGDGYSDLVVGAYKYTDEFWVTPWREGAALVFHGGPAGPGTAPAWIAKGGQESAKYGISANAAGDVNGDGYADLIAGGYDYDGDLDHEGLAQLFHGGTTGLAGSAAWSAEGEQVSAGLGYAVATAGDVNGDNFSDFLVGAPAYNDGEMDEGAAFLHLGAGEPESLAARVRQLRRFSPVPIAPLGLSDAANAFRLEVSAQPAPAVSAVKLEWQVAPLGASFTGPSAVTGTGASWTPVLGTDVVLTQTVDGLSSGAFYRGRVRVLYSPGGDHSRWLHLPWNGPEEGDFRTLRLLEPDRRVYLEPGESAVSTHVLYNSLEQAQTFTLTHVSTPGYTATVSTAWGGPTITLPGPGMGTISVSVETAPETPLGTWYTTTITASSQWVGSSTVDNVTVVAKTVYLPLITRNY